MLYSLTHTIEGELLRINLSGPAEPNRLPSILAQVWQWAQTPGVSLLLADVRDLEGRSSLSQTFFNIRTYPVAAMRIKVAVLDIPERMEFGDFHDTAAGNIGFNFRHFTDEAEALEWLRAPVSSP